MPATFFSLLEWFLSLTRYEWRWCKPHVHLPLQRGCTAWWAVLQESCVARAGWSEIPETNEGPVRPNSTHLQVCFCSQNIPYILHSFCPLAWHISQTTCCFLRTLALAYLPPPWMELDPAQRQSQSEARKIQKVSFWFSLELCMTPKTTHCHTVRRSIFHHSPVHDTMDRKHICNVGHIQIHMVSLLHIELHSFGWGQVVVFIEWLVTIVHEQVHDPSRAFCAAIQHFSSAHCVLLAQHVPDLSVPQSWFDVNCTHLLHTCG